MDNVIRVIGQRIKEGRLQKNLTLEELAERSGCTRGVLSHIEQNRVAPSITILQALAAALDTRFTDFFPETIHTQWIQISRSKPVRDRRCDGSRTHREHKIGSTDTAKIVRRDRRETFHFEGSSIIYSLLWPGWPNNRTCPPAISPRSNAIRPLRR